jgi:hypothetical protein
MMKRFGMMGLGSGKKGKRRAALAGLRGGGMPDLTDLAGDLPGGGFPGLPNR